ncbi:MAG: heavy metal sensor histidine kinase [Candidatus Sulfotelmatobacter sp.]
MQARQDDHDGSAPMMFNSVRIRLTLWYAAAMSVVLVLLAAATYFVIKRNIVSRADAQAMELADTFLSTVNAEMGDATKPDSLDNGVGAAIAEHRFRDVVFAVFDPKGELIGASDEFQKGRREVPLSHNVVSSELRPLLSNANTFQSSFLAGHRYRSYVRHFSFDGEAATLVVLQSLHRQNEFLETLSASFAVVIPLTILITGLGGYFLARRSLEPVVAMSTQASRIGAENLESRLSVRNPKDELGSLAISFNELLDRLDASFERQKRFVADASHELRTPVAILCGETEVTLGKEGRSEQEYRESLAILGAESKRLKHIVEDLFTLARADAGQHPLERTEFYLDELAAECVRNVRTLASARNIAVSCKSEREAPIQADETLLRRMLLNVLDNAIKYTPSGGSVAVRCAEQDGTYKLSVQDSGPGIPAELQSKIFERFFRGDKARSRAESDGGGAGLGLSIASWIASAHGGDLNLVRSSADGSTFTATLPKRVPG